jgi:hypothetical protein
MKIRGWWKRWREKRLEKLMAEARRRAEAGPPVLYFRASLMSAACGGYLIGAAIEGIGHKPWWVNVCLALVGVLTFVNAHRNGRVRLPSADQVGRMVGVLMERMEPPPPPEMKQ